MTKSGRQLDVGDHHDRFAEIPLRLASGVARCAYGSPALHHGPAAHAGADSRNAASREPTRSDAHASCCRSAGLVAIVRYRDQQQAAGPALREGKLLPEANSFSPASSVRLAVAAPPSFTVHQTFLGIGTKEKPGAARAGFHLRSNRAHPTRVPPYWQE
jgi:hypothetical protein